MLRLVCDKESAVLRIRPDTRADNPPAATPPGGEGGHLRRSDLLESMLLLQGLGMLEMGAACWLASRCI